MGPLFLQELNERQPSGSIYFGGIHILPSMNLALPWVCPGIGTSFKKSGDLGLIA